MPLSVRAKGVSLSTATNWFFNFIVGLVTPYLQEVIEWRLYPMHGFFCVCSFVVVYFCGYRFPPTEVPDLIFRESIPRDDGCAIRRDGRCIWRGCSQIHFPGFAFTDPYTQPRRITGVLRESRVRTSLPSRKHSFSSLCRPSVTEPFLPASRPRMVRRRHHKEKGQVGVRTYKRRRIGTREDERSCCRC